MSDLVKVYLYDSEFGTPYDYEWMDVPYSPVGDMLRYSEDHAHMIPREQYERWKAARDAFDQVQREIGKIKDGVPGSAGDSTDQEG